MAITKIPAAGFSDAVNFRNIIINGDMSIAQRATSVSSTGDGYKTCDRWRYERGVGTIDLSQASTVPTGQGFAKSFKVDVTATASPSAGDVMTIEQRIEGQNLQYLKKGTSSAESTTLSFWVRSTKTGTYICELQDVDNSRSISKSYTISSSDTWEKKTLTFAGDTTGAFANDNARSLDIVLWLGAGSNYTSGTLSTSWSSVTNANRAVGQVNLGDSTSNEWYVTGVQLEAGSVASDFEFLPVDCNLQRCQRYFQAFTSSDRMYALQYSSAYRALVFSYVCTMRASPTQSFTAVGGSTTASSATVNSIFRYINLAYTSGTATYIHSLTLDAEL